MAESTLFGAAARFAGGLHDLGGGAHAWLQPNGSWGESNAGLIVGDGASLLVDTLWDPRLTAHMLEAMEPRVAGAPIEIVVNTHSDGDHWWGNQLLSGRRIVTTVAAEAVMADSSVSELRAFERLGRALRLAGGVPLPFPKRGALKAVGDYFGAMAAPFDWTGIELTRPTESFSGETTLAFGGREVRLVEVGPAHTPGDLIVIDEAARVVYAADVCFIASTPVMWVGPVENWVAALDLILSLDVDTVVPGHGPLCGRDEIALLRDYWQWLEREGRERFDRGLSAVESARELARPGGELWQRPWGAWENPERIVINLTTLYRAWDGKPPAHGPRQTLDVFREVALLARDLP